MSKSKLQLSADLGTDFWNDSCALHELHDAVESGATGATSNPVIVGAAVKGDTQTWFPVIDQIVNDYPHSTEDEITWLLIEEMGRRAAKILEPIYNATNGQKGFLSMQVSPKYYMDSKRMHEHGLKLAKLAKNIAIKAPCTSEGIEAMRLLTADGVNVNATVSFSVAQAVAVAEAFESGIKEAKRKKIDTSKLHPYVTLMVGRVDDYISREMTKDELKLDPTITQWAGIAVFKKAYEIFKQKGYEATLLVAAYRHEKHWSELIGPDVLMTIPHNWWNQFKNSSLTPAVTINKPVDGKILDALNKNFSAFRKAYEPQGLKPDEFVEYGATVHTLNQFLTGYQDLVTTVRSRMLK